MVDNWSYWEQKNYLHNLDFIVVGAGIVGYSTALSLKQAVPSANILILERGNLPSGASSKNAGFACFGSPTELYDDIQQFGENVVWQTVKKRWEGLTALRETIGDEHLKLELHGSWDLMTAAEEEIFSKIGPLLPYYNERLLEITGEENVFSVDMDVAQKFGFSSVTASFYNRLEGQIDTASMNSAFYRKVVAAGINVLFGTEVLSIDSSKKEVVTTLGTFTAAKTALCVNGFAARFLPDEDIQPARAQVLITDPIPGLAIRGTFHYQFGYYYFRNIDDRVLFGGGRNLDKRGETTTEMVNTPAIMDALANLLKTVILPNTPHTISHQWSGIMGVGQTTRPIVKKINAHLYCGVRLGGMGVAIGTLVGRELAQLMLDN